MRKWLIQLTHWILQRLLYAAVMSQVDNSHISSVEILVKANIEKHASTEKKKNNTKTLRNVFGVTEESNSLFTFLKEACSAISQLQQN